MVTVTAIYCYPVKSCKPISLESAELSQQGLPFDRHWMVVGPEGKFVTQRNNPRLALIETSLTDDGLQLSIAGQQPITVSYQMPDGERIISEVWGEACEGIDEGAEVSAWLTAALQRDKSMRLIRMADDFERQHGEAEFMDDDEQNRHHVKFSDISPYLVVNESSLTELNKQLIMSGEQPVPMNRFRGNIVVKDLPAFSEHQITALKHADYRLSFRMVCERCVVTTIDQQTAQRDSAMQPFKMLKQINGSDAQRPAPQFGHYAVLEQGAKQLIQVGDELEVIA